MKKQNKNVKNARTFFFNELKKKGGKQKMSKKRYEKLCLDTCNLFNLTARNERREIKIKKVNLFYQHRLTERVVLGRAIRNGKERNPRTSDRYASTYTMKAASLLAALAIIPTLITKSRQKHNKTISLE